jgi:hypothetical protein
VTRSARYKIHAAIAVARVGNARESEFFIGPERPNQPAGGARDAWAAVPPFKSGDMVQCQAARFRIWEYADKDGVWTPSREATALDDDVSDLSWVVHLANRKASFFEFTCPRGSMPRGGKPAWRNPGPDPGTLEDPRTLEIGSLASSIVGRSAGPVSNPTRLCYRTSCRPTANCPKKQPSPARSSVDITKGARQIRKRSPPA